MVETDVRDDPLEPSREATVEAEVVKVPVNAKECILVDLFGLFGRAKEIHGDTQNVLVITLDKRSEGVLIALLRGTYERRFVHYARRFYRRRRNGLLDHQFLL